MVQSICGFVEIVSITRAVAFPSFVILILMWDKIYSVCVSSAHNCPWISCRNFHKHSAFLQSETFDASSCTSQLWTCCHRGHTWQFCCCKLGRCGTFPLSGEVSTGDWNRLRNHTRAHTWTNSWRFDGGSCTICVLSWNFCHNLHTGKSSLDLLLLFSSPSPGCYAFSPCDISGVVFEKMP